MRKPFVHVIRKRGMGDVLWIEPVIRQLATKYSKVIVHTRYNVLFQNYPLANVSFISKQSLVSKLFSRLALWIGRFPFFINLDKSYENNPYCHFLHAYQVKSNLPQTNEYPVLYLSESEKDANLAGTDKYILLHLESYSDKNYRKVFGIDWDKIVEYLIKKGYTVIQIGKEPITIRNVTNMKTASIRDMISLISQSSMFIGIDSGPSHFAASLKVPALIFFGAVNPLYRHFPEQFNGYFLQQHCEYAGCFHNQLKGKEPDCKLVGNTGIPKCSVHTDKYLIEHIDKLLDRN